MHTESGKSPPPPNRTELPTSKTLNPSRSISILQLPLKSANLSLGVPVSFLPVRDKEIEAVTAAVVDRVGPRIALNPVIGLDGILIKLEVVQLIILDRQGSFDVEAALLDLLLELWRMSVQYSGGIMAGPTRLIVVSTESWTALSDFLTIDSIFLLIVPSACSACLMLRSAAPCCLFA
jgi:hypothetical protein